MVDRDMSVRCTLHVHVYCSIISDVSLLHLNLLTDGIYIMPYAPLYLNENYHTSYH